MKTKHILTAMVLPAMLAACTADEIVENNNVANVQGRALLNPMTITVNGGVDSRADWTDEGYGKYVWNSETDKFSAFLLDVDGVENTAGIDQFTGTVGKNELMTNYIYTSEDGIHYTTTSQMVEGAYWFYAPGREKNTRDLIPFKMEPAQTFNYYKESADLQAFYTPIYNLTSVDSPSSLDLKLTPYFGRAVVTITNTTEEDFTLNQIVLESNKDFYYEGEISVKALQEAGLIKTYVADCDEWHYAGATITSTMTDDEKAETYAAKDKAMETKKTTVDLVADKNAAKKTKVLVLNLEGEEGYLAVGQTKEFNLVVPRTDEAASCKVTLIANKGVKTISTEIQSNYQYGIQFKHNGIMPMFGKTADGGFKAYDVKKFDNLGTNVYYVTSYAQMMNLINTVNGDFTVYNIGDWGIDAAMAKLIAEESDVHVYFKNHIYVTAEAQSRTAEDNTIVLKKVTFLNGFTVEEDTEVELAADNKTVTTVTTVTGSVHAEGINVKEGATLKISKGTIYGGMTIAEGATVNLAGGTIYGTIDNKGVLNVTAATVEGSIETYGALTLTNNNPSVNVKAGSVTYATAANTTWTDLTNAKLTLPTLDGNNMVNATVTINSNVKMTLTKAMTLSKYTVPGTTTTYVVKLVNNGEISLDENLTVEGELENAENAEINSVATETLTIKGSATNDGEVNVKYSKIESTGTLENNGTWYSASGNAQNDGTVTLGVDSKTRFNYGSGVINNDELAKNLILQGTAKNNMTVYYTFTSAVNSADVNALDCEEYALNKIIFSEKLTIDVDDEYKDKTCNAINGLSGIKTLQFAKGLEIEADVKNQGVHNKITNIIINGSDVKFKGSNWLGAEGPTVCAMGINGATTITVNKNCKLTVDDMTLCPVGDSAKLTFVSEDATGDDVKGQVVNNGTIYTGKTGTVYNSTTNAWWSGAAAEKGYYNGVSVIIP